MRVLIVAAVTVVMFAALLCAGCRTMNPVMPVGTRNTVIHIEGGTNYITVTPSGGSRMGLNDSE